MANLKHMWIDWLQIIMLTFLAPFFLFPSIKRTWIFFIVPLIWMGRGLIKRQFFERTILDWATLILTIQVFISCLIVPDIEFSLPKIAGILYGIIVFYALVSLLKTEKLISLGVVLYLGGGFLFSIISLLGMVTFWGKYLDLLTKIKERIPRINFNLPGAEEGFASNAVGGTLALIIPLFFVLFYFYILSKKKDIKIIKNRIFAVILFLGWLATSVVLLLTQSRGTWLGMILSSCILLILFMMKKKASTTLIMLFMLIPLVVFSTMYVLLIGIGNIQLGAPEIMGKVMGRTQVWAVGIRTIKKHPFTGIGMNHIRLEPDIGYKVAHVHNHFLHTAAELGIPGVIALLAILIGTGVMCFEIVKIPTARWMKAAAVGLGWGQIAHLIFGLGDSIPLGAKPGIFFWLSISLITSIYNFVLGENSLKSGR